MDVYDEIVKLPVGSQAFAEKYSLLARKLASTM